MGTYAKKSSVGGRAGTTSGEARLRRCTARRRIGAAALALCVTGSAGACSVPAAAPSVQATASAPVAAPSAACLAWQFLDKTNALRIQRGLTALTMLSAASSTARAHSQAMASTGTLQHSNMTASANQGFGGGNWNSAGENIGRGPSVVSVHAALVASPGHYAAMMNPSYDGVGIGVVQSGSDVWVTELFGNVPLDATPATRPRC